jgi:hypothetical protein
MEMLKSGAGGGADVPPPQPALTIPTSMSRHPAPGELGPIIILCLPNFISGLFGFSCPLVQSGFLGVFQGKATHWSVRT